MTLQILPLWTSPDGTDAGPLAIPCRDMTHASVEISRWLRPRAGRPNLRVMLVDDLAMRTVAVYRARKGKTNA